MQLLSYLQYWGVGSPVFMRSAGDEELFIPRGWSTYLDRLQLVFTHQNAIAVITSPAGGGKSTIAKWIYRQLPLDHFDICMISLPHEIRHSGWLVPKVAQFFGITQPSAKTEREDAMRKLAVKFEDMIRMSRKLTVIIDGAEKLQGEDAYSDLSSLINLIQNAEGVISILLFGQTTFLNQINKSATTRSRIHLHCPLEPMNREDLKNYIEFRLNQSGVTTNPFDSSAVEAIFDAVGGTFSRVNALCENALIEAFSRQTRVIGKLVIEEAKKYMMFEPGSLQKMASGDGLTSAYDQDKPAGGGDANSIELSSLFKKSPHRKPKKNSKES